MLVIAAGLGGFQNGVLALAVFTTAMFASNIALTTAATSVFAMSRVSPVLLRGFGVITATYSLVIGSLLMSHPGVV
jgi:hypothetical protein